MYFDGLKKLGLSSLYRKIVKSESSAEVYDSAALARETGWSINTEDNHISGSGISALQITAVFACIRVLSESVGMLPCHLMRAGNNGNIKATDHHLWPLLYATPNGYMTAQEFWELLVVCLCLRGNFYAYKNRVTGHVRELLPLNPDCVTTTLSPDWQPVYKVNFADKGQVTFSQEDIWHVRIFSSDGLHGLNPVAYAREALTLSAKLERHGINLFKNGTIGSGALCTEQKLSEEAYKRLREDFSNKYQGGDNFFRPLILEQGLDWRQLSMKAEDTQFIETRKFQKDDICSIYRVPPHMIANLDKATFSNIEHQSQSFVNYSLMPYLTRIEQRINTSLVPEPDRGRFFAKFNAGALLRGDMATRFESYNKGITLGIMSPNECRELENMNPRKGGDVYLVPLNMQEHGQ